MPKNKGKGGKNRRRGKNENENQKRELVFKEPGQEYAKVDKMLGNGRLHALCFDGRKRLCHIRGKLRKKIWINTGDIILVGLREFQDDKADVILKYSADEARMLKDQKQIPDSVTIEENDQVDFTADADVRFDGAAASDSEEDESEEESSDEESADERDDRGVKINRQKVAGSATKPDAESGDEDAEEEGDEEEEESDNDNELMENPNRPSAGRSKAAKSQAKWGKGNKNSKTRAERAQEEMIDAI